jgi:hypothetical protein
MPREAATWSCSSTRVCSQPHRASFPRHLRHADSPVANLLPLVLRSASVLLNLTQYHSVPTSSRLAWMDEFALATIVTGAALKVSAQGG